MDIFTIHLVSAGVDLWWPGALMMGCLVGFLTGLFGVGGGFLLTPCLRIVMALPYPIAVGSALAQIFVTGTISTTKHWRRNNVDAKLGGIMAAGACAGAWGGKRIMGLLQDNVGNITIAGKAYPALDLVMNILFLILMSTVMISILRETSKSAGDDNGEEVSTGISRWLQSFNLPPVLSFPRSRIDTLSLWAPLGISLFVGVLTGLMGVGGGFVLLPLLVYIIGVPTVVAVGTSTFQIVFASGFSAYSHYLSGNVDLRLAAILIAGSFLGVQSGVYVSGKIDARRIRKYFSLVIGVGILIVIYGLFRILCPSEG